jgi:hypothetical protein
MNMLRPLAFCLCIVMGACAAVRMKLVDAARHPITQVCIQENSKVIVADVPPVIRNALDRHGIGSERHRSDSRLTTAGAFSMLTWKPVHAL